MRLFNQTKNELNWRLAGTKYMAEPWGAVEIQDELVAAVRRLGVPLDVSPVAPEDRARQKIADDETAASDAALRAIRGQADAAKAAERAAKEELERALVELAKVRGDLREANEVNEHLRDKVSRLEADAKAADRLMSEQASKATAAEERAIKAEALLSEKTEKPAKPKKSAGAE